MTKLSASRRSFLFGSFRGTASAAVVGSAWTAWVGESRAAPLALRPPGALADEARFQTACIKCGECVQACPYGTLKLADLATDVPVGTPHFEPRKTPCEMCEDIPCVKKCPTGALDREMSQIRDAKMGVAVLDASSCLSMKGLRCEACYRACPLIDEAITLRYEHQTQTGKHAYFRPTIDPDICTGCGQCERACVTEVPAIRVLPVALATGKIGEHYRLRDHTIGDAKQAPSERPTPAPTSPDTKKHTLDYLNQDLEF
jgi:ferredoxin-type protein NapG